MMRITTIGAAIVLAVAAMSAHADAGVDRMKSIMDAIHSGKQGSLPDATQKAVNTGLKSGESSADLSKMPASTVNLATKQAVEWEQMAREAYVAALPPRDQDKGRSLLLGDGTLPGNQGRLYFFVSRSMPMSLLRAYSLDALYTGAALVVKGVRRGDTIKEFVEDAMSDFNNADGQALASMEINPDLFDMFNVKVVPAVVWTNRIGLDDIGSGCPNLPDNVKPEQLTMEGPDETTVTVDKPTCAQVPESSYYKLTGALALPYVLERFQEAGAPKAAMESLRKAMGERRGNVNDGTVRAGVGNEMVPLPDDLKLDMLPRYVLMDWGTKLSTMHVSRGPFGPLFTTTGEDDPDYRKQLTDKVNHGLGL